MKLPITQYNEQIAKMLNGDKAKRDSIFTIDSDNINITIPKREFEQLERYLNYSANLIDGDNLFYMKGMCDIEVICSIIGIMNYINDTLHGRWK